MNNARGIYIAVAAVRVARFLARVAPFFLIAAANCAISNAEARTICQNFRANRSPGERRSEIALFAGDRPRGLQSRRIVRRRDLRPRELKIS